MLAREIDWSFSRNIALEKDQIVTARVSGSGLDKVLRLRWTLYKKEDLVVLMQYDEVPYQFILNPRNKSFRLSLDSQDLPNHGELLIIFEGFKDGKINLKFLVSGDVNFQITDG